MNLAFDAKPWIQRLDAKRLKFDAKFLTPNVGEVAARSVRTLWSRGLQSVTPALCSGVTKWPDTPNEARVSGHFKSHLKWPNTQEGSELHSQGGVLCQVRPETGRHRVSPETAKHPCKAARVSPFCCTGEALHRPSSALNQRY